MLKLSKTQEKIVHEKKIGTSVIKGSAQSGKSAVAIYRMLHLLEHDCKAGECVLFVSANHEKSQSVRGHLADYYGAQNLSLFDEEPKGEGIIKAIDELIDEAANKADVHLHLNIIDDLPEELLVQVVNEVKKEYPRVKCLRSERMDFIKHELQWMSACGFASLEDYQGAARKGATIKLPKKGSGRKALWQIKTIVGERLKTKKQMTKLQMQLDALQYLKEDALRTCYKHVIVDDAEALTKVQLEFIKHVKAEGPGEVLFLMDKNESQVPYAWLSKGQNFKAVGYDMTGRVRHLVTRKKGTSMKKVVATGLTPLEAFIEAQDEKRQMTMLQEAVKVEEPIVMEDKQIVKNKLPWYVETYRYVNKLTGLETVFQKDSSAGETYIDEVKQDEVDELPVYSDIAAGMPIEIVDGESSIFEMPSELLHHKKNTYILHVQGDSMIGADISDGDYVVIQAGTVNNNEIAAVYYNGATTLKKIVQEEEHVLLVSENPKYRPIVIEDGDFRVMGKLVGVIKPM